jgi:excisionase family DNA binding protein
MLDMNQRLPIPNPEEWADRTVAARLLRVSLKTVGRMADDGRLTPYRIGECLMFWRPEVNQLAEARRIAGIGDDA